MNRTMHYFYRISVGSSKTACPFVCQFMPFIGINEPLVIPFVCKKIPLVCIDKFHKGFTLVELIVTLTVAGILFAIAAPGLKQFVSSNRLTSQANDLMGDISLAKNEAIKHNTTTGICASSTGTSCTASAGDWGGGWYVYYVCPANDSTCVIGANVTIKSHEAITGSNSLIVKSTDTGGAVASADVLNFGKNGTLSNQNFTYQFTLCDSRQKKSRVINTTVIGQPSISEGAC